MSEVKLENIWKIYKTKKDDVIGVKNLNLNIKDGEFVALLGPSGSGKSSTLRMIAGLEEVTKGKIWIGEKVVNEFVPQYRDIAMVFENYALYNHKTVFENIAFPLTLRKISPDEIKKQVYSVSEILKITDILNEKTANLSGGQKQRVSIGRALVRDPKVLLMDEPISHLEAKLRTHMRAEITRLQKRFNRTTIYVTHDQNEAITMANRIAVMNFAELQQYDTPENIFNRPFNEFVAGFVGEPPMNMFDCNLKGDFLFSDNFQIEIPKKIKNEIKKEQVLSKEMILGIRPQDMTIIKDKKSGAISGEIFHWEMRGDEGIAIVKVNKNIVTVKTSAKFNFSKGDKIHIDFDPEKINIFNQNTTKNICVSEKEFVSLKNGEVYK